MKLIYYHQVIKVVSHIMYISYIQFGQLVHQLVPNQL